MMRTRFAKNITDAGDCCYEVNLMQKTGLRSLINTLAVPLVTYSYNLFDWKIREIRKLDTTTRKLFTMHCMHHPAFKVVLKANRCCHLFHSNQVVVDHPHPPPSLASVVRIASRCLLRSDNMMQLICKHHQKRKLYSSIVSCM